MARRITRYILSCVALLASASYAHAAPVAGLIAAISAGLSSIGAALSGLVSFASLGAFLASPIGGLILGIGLQLLIAPLFKQSRQTPAMEASKVNVRIPEPERWITAGRMRQGGGVVFGEYDAQGYFWYLIIHSDSQLIGTPTYYLDELSVELNSTRDVITPEFCLTSKNDQLQLSADGTIVVTPVEQRQTFFRIYTTTYTDANPTPPQIAEFKAAFPGAAGWTDDHKLVGTTYSAIRCKSIGIENRYKVYRWKGPIGLGEPSLSIVGDWSKPYDPRTSTNAATRNSVLIWAWFRMHRYGRNKSFDSINWDRVAEQASICEQTVIDKNGVGHARYQCGSAVPESKERSEAEQEILISCDAQLVFDPDGRVWPRVGYYYNPTLALSRNRDIFAVESVEPQDGESETQGVIVRYIDPQAGYTAQPSAPWVNPLYYNPAETPKYLTIDALGVQDHNQAMRLAKAVGYRSQSLYKLLPTTGLRGFRARQERIISFDYDNEFAGPHEIVTPVEVDENGVFCGFGIVPVDQDRWTLLPGEEKDKPVFSESQSENIPSLPTNVTLNFDGARIIANYDPLFRNDWRVEFQYKLQSEPEANYLYMTINALEQTATSGGVSQNQNYNVRYRTITNAGRATDWLDPPAIVNTSILTLTGTPVTTGKVGNAYGGFTVGVSGGVPPYLFLDLYGRLPPGLSINSSTGVVSGTPTTAGTYANIILRVQDNNNAFKNFPTFTITVVP